MAVNLVSITKDKREYQGLSTDTKPTTDGAGNKFGSGSTFYELDTGNGFTFDKYNICPTTSTNWWPV